MTDKQTSHIHPDSEKQIKDLVGQLKKLQKDVHDLQHKAQTHDHPHAH